MRLCACLDQLAAFVGFYVFRRLKNKSFMSFIFASAATCISNCSNFAVLAFKFTKLDSIFLTLFSIMSSLASLARMEFSCSEIVPIFPEPP